MYEKVLSKSVISNDERLTFSRFLYYTLARTPNFLNYMTWFYHHSEELYPHASEVDLSLSNKLMDDAGLGDGGETLEFMLEMADVFTPIINRMNWQFLTAPIGKVFVTSDNPLILNDPTKKEPYPPFMGWNNPNIELTFPLSPALCMKATWGKRKKAYIKADMSFLRAVNFRTSFFAQRYIYSSCEIEPPPINCTFPYNLVDTYQPYK